MTVWQLAVETYPSYRPCRHDPVGKHERETDALHKCPLSLSIRWVKSEISACLPSSPVSVPELAIRSIQFAQGILPRGKLLSFEALGLLQQGIAWRFVLSRNASQPKKSRVDSHDIPRFGVRTKVQTITVAMLMSNDNGVRTCSLERYHLEAQTVSFRHTYRTRAR